MDRGVDALHGEVGSLDKPNLDLSPTGRSSLICPGNELLQRVPGIWEVGLQNDACVDVDELGFAEHIHERFHREMKIVVLLHVEVDERRWRDGRGLVDEQSKSGGHPGQTVVVGEMVELTRHRGDLDRDVVDVGLFEKAKQFVEPSAGLAFSQDRLAEQVDIGGEAVFSQLLEVPVEFVGFGWRNQMADDRSHSAASQWHDDPRQNRPQPSTRLEKRSIDRSEEGWKLVLGHHSSKLRGRHAVIVGPHDPVDESHHEGDSCVVGDDRLELLRRRPVLLRLEHVRPTQPPLHQCNGAVGETVGHTVGDRWKRVGVSHRVKCAAAVRCGLVRFRCTMPADPSQTASSGLFPCQDELIGLFEQLIDVIFVAKDLDGRYVEVNSAFVRRTGKASKRDVIGARASDLFIDELAERYEEQDAHVLATGESIRDQLELIRRTNGEHGWYLTTKLPVSSSADQTQLVGVVSISRDLHTPSNERIAIDGLQNVVELVRQRLAQTIRVADMAAAADCSEDQLERRMRKVFGVTATQYVLRVRAETAARLLADTDMPLAEVATACGFYDQSDFTRRFARLTNNTPAQFRGR